MTLYTDGVGDDIRTEHLTNISLEHYREATMFSGELLVMLSGPFLKRTTAVKYRSFSSISLFPKIFTGEEDNFCALYFNILLQLYLREGLNDTMNCFQCF